MRFASSLLLSIALLSTLNAQVGQFDGIVLDGSQTAAPYIHMTKPDRDHFISGYSDRLDFFVNNSSKFQIHENAATNLLTA